MSKKPVDPPAANVFAAGITIDPITNFLTLNPNDTFDETITVTIPQGGAAGIANVKLVASATVLPFITSITPAGGYSSLSGREEHKLPFEVKFHGIPCKTEQQVISGTIDVVIASASGAGGQVVASKKVQITVPPCAVDRQFVYAVKFVCGVQGDCACECASVQPGRYATEINIHNYSSKEVRIHKRFIPVVLAGAAAGREPGAAGPRAEDDITLPPHSATMDDCCRISELLFGAAPSGPVPVTIGFVEITATSDVAVTAVYTTTGLQSGGVSIEVAQVAPNRG